MKELIFLTIILSHFLMATAQNKLDLNRINSELKQTIEGTAQSLEIDSFLFLNNPEVIQQERAEFTRNNPIKKPDHIQVRDIFIESTVDKYNIRLHCYQPKDYSAERVILYFHGGGYIFGQPEQVDEHMFQLATAVKATIISVDYRLSPQYSFPIPVTDGFDALQWIIRDGKKALNIQPDAITVYGASAGGHLAAAVTQMAIDNNVKNIKHQFLLYPVIHNKLNTPSMEEFTDAPLWNKKYAEIAWRHFLGKDKVKKSLRYADLTHFDKFTNLPRTTIVACELDPLRDEGIAYAQQLYQAGVPTELWVIPGALHVFDLFPSALTDKFTEFLTNRILMD
ncbi:MAG: alpha/beta hydrolase [Sphingobacterium sp.]|jgi:acetyl esterase|nr:alpha/beta hydrolase [Sphingobacterium sp.]